jgi:hypothetical protein
MDEVTGRKCIEHVEVTSHGMGIRNYIYQGNNWNSAQGIHRREIGSRRRWRDTTSRVGAPAEEGRQQMRGVSRGKAVRSSRGRERLLLHDGEEVVVDVFWWLKKEKNSI